MSNGSIRNRRSVRLLMETNDPVVRFIPREYRAFVVIGAGFILQATFGLVYSFGNILPYLTSYLRWKVNPEQTNGSLLWLQSLMSGIPGAMIVGGLLEKRFGARIGVLIGSSMYLSGLLISYLTIQESYFLLLLSLGLFASFGQGISYVNVLTQCQRWVSPSKVGLVSGIITSGFGSSAFIVAPLETRFVNPDNLPVGPDNFFHQKEILERVPQMFLLLGIMFTIVDFVGLLFIAQPSNDSSDETEGTSLLVSDEENDERNFNGSNEIENSEENNHIVVRRASLSKRQLLTSPTLIMLSLTLLNNAIWIQITSGLFKLMVNRLSKMIISLRLSIRLLLPPTVLVTSYQFTMSIACSVGATLMFFLPLIKYIALPSLYFIWIASMFTIIGATYTLIPFGIHRSFGPENFGIAYGFVQICLAVSGCLTALMSQFLLPIVGFDFLFLITGISMVISLVLTLLIRKSSVYGAKL
ncbi:hypothetical protein M3Y98_00941100 [Aphelenchoides besseyi]|nr:hypothetical protein M3Y98_00941100 [Aphelenchoides besseyi]KAI6194337.1 hypothetical protein M3Y96_01114300 [Aphelenchoides besseyi]